MSTVILKPQQLHEINRNTYMIWIYMDQAEKCVTNIKQISKTSDPKRQAVLQKLRQMEKLATAFRKELNAAHSHNPDRIVQFGEVSDNIETQIKTDLYYSLKKELNL